MLWPWAYPLLFRIQPKTSSMKRPLVVLLVGMAGTGKSTVAHRLHLYCIEQKKRAYFINLDPAAFGETAFACNIDIRDTIDYKQVMHQYKLGPNGAIMTALNLYATKFHQVISILEQKEDLEFIFVDTPGQIEVFTWSASGQLITEAFSSTFPTCIMFVGDTARCTNPQTFMSTMLYSSSILYKSQVPLLLCLNKCDIVSGDTILSWIRDTDTLSEALREAKGYGATLTASLALFIHEFYENIPVACASALTGDGFSQLCEVCLPKSKQEYLDTYLPHIERRAAKLREAEEKTMATQRSKLSRDLSSDV